MRRGASAARRFAASALVLSGMLVLLAGVPATAARHAAPSGARSSEETARSGEETAGSSADRATSPRVFVAIRASAFDPDTIEVPVGGTVRWTNEDDKAHTVTSDSGRFLSDRIPPGGSYEYRFEATGTFYYHDSLNSRMRGTIEVRATRPSSTTATAATTAPSTAATTAPPSTVTSVGPPDDLAYTGAGTVWLLAAGLALCGVGALVLIPVTRPALARTSHGRPGRSRRTRSAAPAAPRRSRAGTDDPLAGPGR